VSPKPPPETSLESREKTAEAAGALPPDRIPSVAEILAGGQRQHGAKWTQAHAEAHYAKLKANAEEAVRYRAAVERTVERMVAEHGESMRPVDAMSEVAATKAAPLVDPRWGAVRRWPWVAVWDENYSAGNPPWAYFPVYAGHQRAITECLQYCLRWPHLPRLTPMLGAMGFLGDYQPRELPLLNTVFVSSIPRSIVKLYPMARCAECLAFVWSFRGGPDMEEIRRLIAVPTLERVAEAYAIATGGPFKRARIVERYEESTEPAREPLDLLALRKAFPVLLRSSGVANRIMAKLLSAEDAMSVRQLGGGKNASGGARNNASRWLTELENVNLAKRVGNFWKRGAATFVS